MVGREALISVDLSWFHLCLSCVFVSLAWDLIREASETSWQSCEQERVCSCVRCETNPRALGQKSVFIGFVKCVSLKVKSHALTNLVSNQLATAQMQVHSSKRVALQA